MQHKKIILLFSGGQDSAICLALALEKYTHLWTMGFHYGQNHRYELQARENVLRETMAFFPHLAHRFQGDRVLTLSELNALAPSQLTRTDTPSSPPAYSEAKNEHLPATFVPGRNLLFFTYAAIWGYHLDCFQLMGGMCEVDYSGYPDCREDTLQNLAQTLQQGLLKPFSILTPLMHVTKAESWRMVEEKFGPSFVELVVEHTHTCYRNERNVRHIWGYGCGECDACRLRARGYESYLATHS